MTDADIVTALLDALQSDVDWRASGVAGEDGTVEHAFEAWDPDDHPDVEDLETLAVPRVDALRDLFEQHADVHWRPGAVPREDEDFPCRYHHGWHRGNVSVEIGAVQHDNGLPVIVVLRAYESP